MAESMRGLKRSHRCTEVSSADIGSTVTVMGWVQRRRNLGSLIFIDLRDRSGLLQIVFDENSVGSDGFAKAETLRSEYVIAVVGKIQKRSAAVNENLKTGDIEVIAESLRILSESDTPPFHIEENSQTKDEIRLKYRYLDLRRPDLQRNLMLRSKVAYLMRDFMAKEGFDREREKLEREERNAEEALAHAFDFMEKAFEDGEEMVLFVTELTVSAGSARFLAEHPSEKYEQYKETLLIGTRKAELLSELNR